jgi:serine/threonine-protein kinase
VAEAVPKVGDILAGKYKVESVVGEGGMGTVYAAQHQLTGKRVAVKWMLPNLAADEDAVQRFMREAMAAGRIDHPNVVDVYDVGEHAGSPFLVMEFLSGETLADFLSGGEHTARQIIEVLVPAMRGVAAAHRTGVVHRDLKPENIFLARDSEGRFIGPKVLDFGISKVSAADGQVDPKLTKTGAVVGTPYYMSPEQIRGSSDVDKGADIYAFGVIMYEALTGCVPFNADTYSALILEIATGTPRPPRALNPELPVPLEAIIMKAMARERGDRHPDLETLIADLDPFARSAGFTIRPSDATTRRRAASAEVTGTPFAAEGDASIPTHRGTSLAIGALLLLVLGAGGVWLMRSGEDEPPPNIVQPAAVGTGEPSAPATTPTSPTPPTTPPTTPATAPKPGATPRPVAAKPSAAQKPDAGTAAKAVAPATPDPAAAERKRAIAERRRAAAERRRAARKEKAAAKANAKPTTAPPPRPQGRTGTLRVDDF